MPQIHKLATGNIPPSVELVLVLSLKQIMSMEFLYLIGQQLEWRFHHDDGIQDGSSY